MNGKTGRFRSKSLDLNLMMVGLLLVPALMNKLKSVFAVKRSVACQLLMLSILALLIVSLPLFNALLNKRHIPKQLLVSCLGMFLMSGKRLPPHNNKLIRIKKLLTRHDTKLRVMLLRQQRQLLLLLVMSQRQLLKL